ncbi:MAG: acyltransferase, partial [Bacteroidales bacterium]|nr:acyltransferase [Candidatus Equimonas faecalis]
MKERDLQLDLVRVFSCIMIICMHAPMPTEKAISYFNLAICYLTIPGLCLFFIISGTLLLPVKIDTRTFLKHRLGKVVVPTLFFSVFYIILNIIIGEQKDIIKIVCSIPFSAQGSGVLWFMYTLTGLYILAPILSRWLVNASQREIEFYLLLWGITLCYPLLNLILDINETQ